MHNRIQLNQVLWMRQRDLHILTSSLHTYTNDWRISAVHTAVRDNPPDPAANASSAAEFLTAPSSSSVKWPPKWNGSSASRSGARFSDAFDDDEEGVWSEWTLRIRSAQVKDAGLYECQVSTEPKISRIYRLHVVGNFQSNYFACYAPRLRNAHAHVTLRPITNKSEQTNIRPICLSLENESETNFPNIFAKQKVSCLVRDKLDGSGGGGCTFCVQIAT